MSGRESRLLGRWGEALAADFLRKKGWEILDAGWRCRFGELDLVAREGDCLCFVEVKLRKSDRFAPGRAFVDRGKQERIRTTAELYLAQNPTKRQPRFDVAEVYAPQGTATAQPKIVYLENAF